MVHNKKKKNEDDEEKPKARTRDTCGDSVRSKRKKKSKIKKKNPPKENAGEESCNKDVPSIKQDTLAELPYKKSKGQLVKKFVEDALNKKVNGLVAEFRKHKRINDYTKMTEFMIQNANGRNRYKDVGCLDNNRVILAQGPCPYIHANYVATPNNAKKFICTQGPLPATCGEFWYMISQENVNVILMLCNYTEMGTNKCTNYFPTNVGQTLEFGASAEIKVTAKKADFHKFSIDTKVKIMVTQLEVQISDKTMNTVHYHWQDWPDRGVPEADMAPILLLQHLEKESKGSPVVVHCSAGIGRTGSIVLIDIALETLQNGTSLEPMVGYMEEVRKQRNNSVQTEHQYLYIHQILLLYLKLKGYIDPSIQTHLENFTKEYVKTTTGF